MCPRHWSAATHLVDVGMPHLGEEAEGWGGIRIVDRELDVGLEDEGRHIIGHWFVSLVSNENDIPPGFHPFGCPPLGSMRGRGAHLKVASLVECVRWAKDGHLPVVQVGLLHQRDAEALHRLLLEGLQLHHQGLLGAGGGLVGHPNPTADINSVWREREREEKIHVMLFRLHSHCRGIVVDLGVQENMRGGLRLYTTVVNSILDVLGPQNR